MEYIVPKRRFNKKSVFDRIEVRFKNGDFLTIRKNEIVLVDLQFYDKLVFFNRGCHPVASGGYIKIKLQDGKAKGERRRLYNPQEYTRNRKEYIEKRLLSECDIDKLQIYNDDNWDVIIFGDIYAEISEGFLILRFKNNGCCDADLLNYHTVKLGEFDKNNIGKILLDFENCDGFEIFPKEIVDMQLTFEKKLEWDAYGLNRVLKEGYIRIRFDSAFEWREVNMYRGKTIPAMKRRLCGYGGKIDICHLYITFDYPRYVGVNEECIGINDLRYKEEESDDAYYNFEKKCCFGDDENEYLSNEYDEEDYEDEDCDDWSFISGYAQKEDNGDVLIVFGKEK